MAASPGCQLRSYFSIFLRTRLLHGALKMAKSPNPRNFGHWITDVVNRARAGPKPGHYGLQYGDFRPENPMTNFSPLAGSCSPLAGRASRTLALSASSREFGGIGRRAAFARRSAQPATAIRQRDALKASQLENSAACASVLPQTLTPPFVAALHENAYSSSVRDLDSPIPRSGRTKWRQRRDRGELVFPDAVISAAC